MKTKITHIATAKKAALRGQPGTAGIILAFPIVGGWKKEFAYGDPSPYQIKEYLGELYPGYEFESADVVTLTF